jgi:hypothetical protein
MNSDLKSNFATFSMHPCCILFQPYPVEVCVRIIFAAYRFFQSPVSQGSDLHIFGRNSKNDGQRRLLFIIIYIKILYMQLVRDGSRTLKSYMREVVCVAFRDGGGYLLNTQEARKAFCSEYKDQLYNLAFGLTRDQKQACNLVVGTFQHAFLKYASTPCPDDCMPFLSSAIYLLYANGDETNNVCSVAASAKSEHDRAAQNFANTDQAYTRKTNHMQQEQPAPDYVSVREDGLAEAESDPEVSTEPAAEEPLSQDDQPRPDESTPRHAQTRQADFSQPLSRQVFDPAHTDYWTPGAESTPPPSPVHTSAGRAPEPPQTGNRSEQPEQKADYPPDQLPQQPNFSQAYMYDAKIAKKRKSSLLRIINALLFFLLVWMSIGLLTRMEVLPQWNLGYAWFNLYIFPLF